MDDEVKRRIAASLDQPLDPKRDRDAIRALEKDPQAKAWAEGLKKVESALRRWPAPARTAAQWEDFASQIEGRLGEAPSEVSFDPFAPPVLEGDDGDATHAEQTSMAQSPDKNDDDDLEALAALTRSSSAPTTSMAPPPPVNKAGPSLHDDLMDESSGIVDMKQLAELALKQPAPPPASSLSPTASDAGSSSDSAVMAGEKPTARAAAATPAATAGGAAKTAPIDIASARAAQPAKKGPSIVLWLTPVIAAAAVAGFVFLKNGQRTEPAETASRAEPSTEGQNAAPAAAPPAVVAAAPAQPVALPSAPMPAPVVAANDQTAAPALEAPAPPAAPAAAAPPAPPGNVALAGPAPAEPAPVARIAAGHAADSETRHAAHNTGAVALAETNAPADERAAPAAHGSRGGTATAAPAAVAAPAPTPAPTVAAAPHATAPAATHPGTATTADGHPRSMDDLMAQAVGGSHTAAAPASTGAGASGGGAAAPAAGGELPDGLSRAQVTATMAPLSAAVRACTQGQTGMATVAMVILHDGSVQNASVSGPFSSDANNCIAGVVRRAHFPQFTRPSIPMMYPFSIQPGHPGGN